MDDERSFIRNRKYASQIREFSGLKFGTIIPTDIDGLIEYKDKAFILIETKHKESELPFGQKLALERLCDAIQKDKPALLIVASHESEGDIDVANTAVTEFRFNGHWHKEDIHQTTRQVIDRFLGMIDKHS